MRKKPKWIGIKVGTTSYCPWVLMAFNINSILCKKEDPEETVLSDDCSSYGGQNRSTNHSPSDFSVITPLIQSAVALNPLYAIANDIKQPSLVELQMLFGFGARKHEYKRSRKTVFERKPRQAYSVAQLQTLEQEFKDDKYLSVQKRIHLSETLQLTETQIKTWFQNRRTKWKKQMTQSLKELYRQNVSTTNSLMSTSAASRNDSQTSVAAAIAAVTGNTLLVPPLGSLHSENNIQKE
ncbi:hypothetical protein FO519_000626 [Halicephalobus sp. NKZ332]|nr:hypothetical protein FO519_000626 [Halicephalobus sp. NKZ332]